MYYYYVLSLEQFTNEETFETISVPQAQTMEPRFEPSNLIPEPQLLTHIKYQNIKKLV